MTSQVTSQVKTSVECITVMAELLTDRVKNGIYAIVLVRLSVRLIACLLLPFYLFNRLTFELVSVCTWVMTIALTGLKFKVICQGQRSRSTLYTAMQRAEC